MSELELIEQKNIQEAIDCLDEILSEESFPVSIMVETSEDESVMIGTNQAFIWLASNLLKALLDVDNPQAHKVEINDCETRCVALKAGFNPLGHIVPSSLCVTNNDKDSHTVVQFFQRIDP